MSCAVIDRYGRKSDIKKKKELFKEIKKVGQRKRKKRTNKPFNMCVLNISTTILPILFTNNHSCKVVYNFPERNSHSFNYFLFKKRYVCVKLISSVTKLLYEPTLIFKLYFFRSVYFSLIYILVARIFYLAVFLFLFFL